MGRTCKICTHPQRNEIDQDLAAGNVSYNAIQRKYNVLTDMSLIRHKRNHLPKTLVKAQKAMEVANADDLLTRIQQLEADAKRIAQTAEDRGDLRTSIYAIRELTRIVELLAKLEGELQTTKIVNIYNFPQWVELRAVILKAVEPFPQARFAIVDAIAKELPNVSE